MDLTTELFLKYADEFKDFLSGTKIEPGKEAQIQTFVNTQLPLVISTARNIFADKEVNFLEIYSFAVTVSGAVRSLDGLYVDANRTELKVVARELFKFAIRELFVGDEKVKKQLLNDTYLDGFIELIYRLAVKRRIFG